MGKFVKILESLKNNPGGLTFSKFDINEMTESNQEGEEEESFHEDPSKSKQKNQESENDIGSYTKLIYSIVKDFFSGVIEINSMSYFRYFADFRGFKRENQIFTPQALSRHSEDILKHIFHFWKSIFLISKDFIIWNFTGLFNLI